MTFAYVDCLRFQDHLEFSKLFAIRFYDRLNLKKDDVNVTIGYLMLALFVGGFIGAILAGSLVDKFKKFKMIAFICGASSKF